MRRRHERKYTRIDDSEIVRAVDDQVGVDDAAQVARHHGARARVVVLGAEAVLEDGVEGVGARVPWDRVVRGHEFADGRCVEDALV